MKVGLFPYKPGGNPYQSLFAASLESAGLEVLRIPPKKMLPLHIALSYSIDVLHMDWPHDWYSGRNWVTKQIKRAMYFRGLKKLSKFPCVWTAHNFVAHDAVDYVDERRMIQALIDACSGVVVLSNAAKAAMVEMYSVQQNTVVSVIPHGHYIDVYPNQVSKGESRAELDIEGCNRVVLYLGRILPYKGLDRLILSFADVAEQGDVLIIAGSVTDGGTLQALENLAKEHCPKDARVLFHGEFIPDERLQYYFNACDVVALPFREILNSGSLLLAMSFGKCVVAPRIGSIPEIACPVGYFGYDQNDQMGIAAALNNVFSIQNRAILEEQILDFTKENYSWEHIGHKMIDVYDGIEIDRS